MSWGMSLPRGARRAYIRLSCRDAGTVHRVFRHGARMGARLAAFCGPAAGIACAFLFPPSHGASRAGGRHLPRASVCCCRCSTSCPYCRWTAGASCCGGGGGCSAQRAAHGSHRPSALPRRCASSSRGTLAACRGLGWGLAAAGCWLIFSSDVQQSIEKKKKIM